MKGMGEGGAVAPPAAIANAVRDALAAIGAEVNETPMTAAARAGGDLKSHTAGLIKRRRIKDRNPGVGVIAGILRHDAPACRPVCRQAHLLPHLHAGASGLPTRRRLHMLVFTMRGNILRAISLRKANARDEGI